MPLPNLPTTVASPPSKPFSEPWLRELLRGTGVRNGVPMLMAGVVVTPTMRSAIGDRIQRVRSSLASTSDTKALAVVIARLLAAFPSRETGSHQKEAYFEAVRDAPAWAIEQARVAIISGSTDLDARFAPTPPQLGKVVAAILAPVKRDLADLERIAEAADAAAGEGASRKQFITDGFDDLRSEIAGSIRRMEG